MKTDGSGSRKGRLLHHMFLLDGIYRLLPSQPGHFPIQGRHNRGQPPNPLSRPRAFGESLLSVVLVPKQPLSQRPVPALHNALVPVDVRAASSNRNPVLCQQLASRTHELTSRVNLEKLGPLQGPPFVDALESGRDLSRGLACHGLGFLIAAGNVNERESVLIRFPPDLVVWNENEVSLVDLIWLTDVKPRARAVPWRW